MMEMVVDVLNVEGFFFPYENISQQNLRFCQTDPVDKLPQVVDEWS